MKKVTVEKVKSMFRKKSKKVADKKPVLDKFEQSIEVLKEKICTILKKKEEFYSKQAIAEGKKLVGKYVLFNRDGGFFQSPSKDYMYIQSIDKENFIGQEFCLYEKGLLTVENKVAYRIKSMLSAIQDGKLKEISKKKFDEALAKFKAEVDKL